MWWGPLVLSPALRRREAARGRVPPFSGRCRLPHGVEMFPRPAALVASLSVLLTATLAPAQVSRHDQISADRPGQATSTTVIPTGSLQIETGYRVSNQRDETRFDLGELNVRWGLSSWAELRVAINSYRIVDRPGDDDPEGFEDSSVGLKLGVGDPQSGARPQMALIVDAGLPIGDRRIGGEKIRPSLNWAADWALSSGFSLTGNLKYEWNEDSGQRFNQVTAALSLGVSLSPRWGGFVEVYGHNRVTKDGQGVGVADLGVTYLLTRTLQLDAHVGHGFQSVGPERWAGLGLSHRF